MSDDEVRTDLEAAIAALDELMDFDKGPDEAEWAEWSNRHLALVQKYGRQERTIDFG